MLFTLYLIAGAMAAYVPSDNYSTLTPAAAPTGTTDYTASFGIQIETVASAKSKRDVAQIGDGQIQNQSATKTVSIINQIGDGQIQNQSATKTVSVINQIGDGQIQNQSATPTPTTAKVINQIGDGQIQNQSATSTPTASVIHQITDGQIQNQPAASQISDGQIQNSKETSSPDSGKLETCSTPNGLSMTLKDSVLKDSKGRIGAIVANRQFQFDGPPPQAGSIYAAGWAVDDGYLALGNQTEFFQCKSGDFYNLYDENVAEQCESVKLAVVDFISC